MIKIIGVRFRNAGKVYYFAPGDLEIRTGDHVIVETARGMECGKVVLSPREVTDDRVVQPLREVLRVANAKDLERERINREKESSAYQICQQKIREHKLDMKLIQAEYTFDNKKVLFYFTSDGRVDFRDLVKDLASVFKTRIELRQIGVRDETKMLGGIGICGRPLCCSTFLSDFAPVSIKMAKEQNLSLNPSKISGVCGRLLCCLKNEQETYEYLNKQLPETGDLVVSADGREGEVHSINVLRQMVRVLIEDGGNKEIVEYPASEVTVSVKRRNRHRDKEGKKEKTERETKAAAERPVTAEISAEDDAGDNKEVSEKERRPHRSRADGRRKEAKGAVGKSGRQEAESEQTGRETHGRKEKLHEGSGNSAERHREGRRHRKRLNPAGKPEQGQKDSAEGK